MLVDFSFTNYRSFRDAQAFSMQRESRFIEHIDGLHTNLSTVTAVYGANASGKSNLLRAFAAMQEVVRSSYSSGDATSQLMQDPFALNKQSRGEPTEFFAEFIAADGLRYQYSFSFNNERICTEELRRFNKIDGRDSTKTALVFAREGDDVFFGTVFKGSRMQVKQTVRRRRNALVLSACAAAGIEITQSAFDFFAKSVHYYQAASFSMERDHIINELVSGSQFARDLTQLIRYADFGIDSLEVEQLDTQNFFKQLQEDEPERFEEGGDLRPLLSRPFYRLLFNHAGEDGVMSLDQGAESLGTQAALAFFSVALTNLIQPSVTLIDEIDTSLHPKLVEEIVKLYADPETNPYHAQLIFTTHDMSLINVSPNAPHVLQPDQIWFVEKAKDGSSEIYPATDLNVRKDENIGRNYLNGVYGAMPEPSFHAVFARIMAREVA